MKALILSYNHPQITERCLNSCQNHFLDSDIILIHNGSEQKWVNHLKSKYPLVDHLVLLQNLNYSGGVNTGLNYAFSKTNWILLVTNDCELLNFSFTSFNNPGFYAPLIFLRKTRFVDSIGGAVDPVRGKLRHLKSTQDKLKSDESLYIPGSSFLLHKDIYAQTSGMNEKLFTYWEDVEFSFQCQQNKIPLHFSESIELLHHGGKTCHKDPHYTTYLYQRNRLLVSKRILKLQDRSFKIFNLYFYFLIDLSSSIAKNIKKQNWKNSALLLKAMVEGILKN